MQNAQPITEYAPEATAPQAAVLAFGEVAAEAKRADAKANPAAATVADAPQADTSQEPSTVRSGMIFKLKQQAPHSEDEERAAKIKEQLGTEPLTGIEGRLAYRFIKRTFDIVFSLAVLILFCWLFAIIAIAIKIDDPKGPIIFKQERVGKNGKTFNMYKFRSMCVDAEAKLADLRELNEKTGPVFKMAEDPRVTRVGKWLRKLSVAWVIIGTPGDGESTKSLSHSAKTSNDLQLCERRPGLASCVRYHYTSPEFLSFGFFGGSTSPLFGATAKAVSA